MAQILLVRHCESSGQAADAPLTERGVAQAHALADYLASHPVDAIVSSPYLRAQQTIAPFAARAALPVELEPRLAERRLARESIPDWKDVVRLSFEDPEHRRPGGESGGETLARALAVIDSVLSRGHALPVLVSHGQLLSLVLHSVDPEFGFASWESLSNPDVYRLEERSPSQRRFLRLWR